MIQSSYKPVELKAPESAKAPLKKPELHTNSAPKEKSEFRQELKKASKSESSEPKVKAVKVSEDQSLRSPSSLVNENLEGNPESVSPKVFDPALTKDVQNLIDPKTVQGGEGLPPEEFLRALMDVEVPELSPEVTEKLSPELTQKLLNSKEGEAAGKALLATVAAQEAGAELVNVEDFVAQKNMAAKKMMPQGAYGMKAPAANKEAAEAGLKSTEVVKDISLLENSSGGSSSMNSQQFILNSLAEQGTNSTQEVSAPVKTFDMSQIKTSEPDKIMTAISDYIAQAKAAKEPTVNLRMNHQDLGMIDITVMKTGAVNADSIAINIGAHTADGKNFFQQNSKDLFAHLSSAGISVTDMKVETASNSGKSDFDMNQQNQKHASSGEKQFGSEQNERRHEQNRREDLWKMFNKEAA
jgi:hypothetical protein